MTSREVGNGVSVRQPSLELEPADRLLLVDGHNLIFRAFSSVPRSITDPNGRAVNGIYGFFGTLLRMLRDRRPRWAAVAFDVPEIPTFRHRLFPAYQGQRGPLGAPHAENFAWQVENMILLLEHFGLAALTAPGFEADDIIATLARGGSVAGVPSLIVTTDRDLQQLVQPLVRVLVPGKKPVEIGAEEVKERLGVEPSQIVDWKILAGDASDNIPGVAGIGDRSAVQMLRQYGSLAAIYDSLDRLPLRQRLALERGRETAQLFSQVIRLHDDLPLGVDLDDLTVDYGVLPERAGDGLRELGLRPPENAEA